MIKEIWFIHGAASTSLSFSWLKDNIAMKDVSIVDINYSTETPLTKTIDTLTARAIRCKVPPILIGHSLGGIIATSIAQKAKVEKIVTISTPFGGSFAASIIRWFLPNQFMKDICQQSPILTSLRLNLPKIPILSIVTDSDLSIMGESTDGVVTVRSQTILRGPQYVTIKLNHFEVLLSPKVANLIQEFIG